MLRGEFFSGAQGDVAAAGTALADARQAEASGAAAVDAARAAVGDAIEWRSLAELCLSEASPDDPESFMSAATDYQAAVEFVAEATLAYDAACVTHADLQRAVAAAQRRLESVASHRTAAAWIAPVELPRGLVVALLALAALAIARFRLRTPGG